MKKSLVALATLAATGAFAQSSVQLIGVIDAGYKTVSVDKNPLAKFGGIANNGNSTSQFDFVGTEDLGGGMKASFFNELDFNPVLSNTANQGSTAASFNGQVFNGTPFTGQQYVGLEGSWGSTKIGTPNSAVMDTNLMAQPFGTNLGGGYSSGFGRLGTSKISGANQYVGAEGATGRVIRFQKTINYATPVMNGFQAQVEYSAKNDAGQYQANENGVAGFNLKYSQGPLNLGLNSTKVSAGAIAAAGSVASPTTTYVANNLIANSSTTWNTLAGNYNFGAATIYGGYTTTKSSGNSTAGFIEDSKSWNIAGKYVMGNIDLLANYLKRKSNLSETQVFCETSVTAAAGASACTAVSTNGANGAAGVTIANGTYNPTQTMIGLGANYNLSKNTFAYYRFERISGLNANANVTNNGAYSIGNYGGATQTTNMVGVKMSF